ncbi:HAMP domain-containing sensor histidine kinase [Propionimicrobium sp. PCR01-08-3]|uniref:sensor histidine kinase n=1 Tax=Propionimicrobium sp. PCR01-08-3 TaxID=3052086 RepID=UPI00255CA4F5|nr:HAMP domain-containing sensor histidine kinase [Propionimicrobium sp. PCR01-08-3]WIY82683.1 HAMP domain-containing sensor histidine kinase [Propionimicrobium sp. PCR01-08-3]
MADKLRQTERGSLQLRLAYLTAIGVALSVLLIGMLTYVTARSSMYSQLDQELLEVASYASEPISTDVEGLGGVNASALQATNVTILLVRADKSVVRVQGISASIDPGPDEIAIARTQTGSSTRSTIGTDEQPYRVVAVPLSTETGRYAIVLARPLTPTLATLRDIGRLVGVCGGVLVLLSASMGYLTGRRLMAPLRELSNAVTRVSETDELAPLGLAGSTGVYSTDEIGDLSRSFDTMMHSLASSRDRQRRLIADAGHELRTPLTSMRTNIELLVADEKSGMLPPGARAEILTDVAAQLGEFTSLVGDLVQLSRDDVVMPSREPLDFADVVAAAVERAKRRGPGLDFDVTLQPHFIVGEPDTLERAVTNLLDNAVKFSPDGGTVHVKIAGDELTIWDEGPGIAAEDLDKIFDRFYRSNKARNTPGTGLGLSIVAHTINAHGGTVSASNQEGAGAKFTVVLPAAPPETLAEYDD